jgi:salicylate hydroxylase
MHATKAGLSMADVLIAGGGIGGLATALALQRQGLSCELWEQAPAFAETGAGIQMGPNVTRIMHDWGLLERLNEWAAAPESLVCRDATDGRVLGQLDLKHLGQRYGAPYLTIHRADLHAVLLQAIQDHNVTTHLNRQVSRIQMDDQTVQVHDAAGQGVQARVLVGADGLWSQVRSQVWQDSDPTPRGHWAYRSLLPMNMLPQRWRAPWVQVWLAPGLHAVHYPVRRGQWMNLVLLVESQDAIAQRGWDVQRTPQAMGQDVQQALRGLCPDLHELMRHTDQWRAWSLCDRDPLTSPHQMVRQRVALLGDAAHPMLPYLAQGAAMAIEDADVLARCLGSHPKPEQALLAYAHQRWARNARVQQKARRNGAVFHAGGFMAMARNTALRWAAPWFMDQPWLYAAPDSKRG